ncbi:MAG: succinate dehydrogenase, cytochrome b556 subunit [Alteromonadales bacterium]|nr:succinate dehydrogenase, cytochrome b556 subunit [Alteromonadales bacterium]
MADTRPKNLDLSTIKLPIMGLASILHRISAVIIWVAMIFFLPVLYISLESAEGFNQIKTMLTENFFAQFFLWGFLTAFGYYITGGLKHIIQEFGYFESLEGGATISKAAIGLGICLSILSGFWIWG